MTTAITNGKPVTTAWLSSEAPSPTLQAVERVLAGFIDPRERIVWCAQPDPESLKDLEKSKSNAWWAPAAIGGGILAFTLYQIGSHFQTYLNDPSNIMNFWMQGVVGIVTLGIGVFSLLSPQKSCANAKYTLYAITTERAIILEPATLPSGRQKVMHWKFTAIGRTAMRDMQSRKLPGKVDLQDVIFTYTPPQNELEELSRSGRGEMPVETTERAGFFGVPADTNVEELLRNLRGGSLT